jgi:lipopolysaccharide/colanic/teichoic acid biosynthesis glycosyltransferase
MLAGGVDYEDLVPYYRQRLAIRPGLSGWAQVNGLRGPTTDIALAIARIEHDLAYIQNLSILLDVRIILRTLVEVLRGSGS